MYNMCMCMCIMIDYIKYTVHLSTCDTTLVARLACMLATQANRQINLMKRPNNVSLYNKVKDLKVYVLNDGKENVYISKW